MAMILVYWELVKPTQVKPPHPSPLPPQAERGRGHEITPILGW